MQYLHTSLLIEHRIFKQLELQLARQKAIVDDLKNQTIESMKALNTSTLKNQDGRISLLTKASHFVTDWDSVYKFIHENYAFDLLQRRLSVAAVADRIEEGESLLGIGAMSVESLRITLTK